ncbi:Hsp20 family protein [uncultured Enterobacter sp.]|uniref:Hsp20 family protein n=1 Tax=uncultured Enterobacter sp. TaxID=238202 RepID=UPI002588DC26|nr:Hsp20 family protein [uncultured Enterobacter sp.]
MMTLRTFPVLNDLSDSLFADRFNRIDRLFSQLTGSTPLPSTPSYNIRRLGDNRYELTLSVPGWKESELEIETVGGQLNISGKCEEEKTENGEEGWIHRGISRSDFRASYSLPEHVKVTGASLENGLLAIELHQDIPEEEKPQRIAINNNPAIEHKP